MQTTQKILFEKLPEILTAIYDQGDVFVKQAYSDFERPAVEFKTGGELINDMTCQTDQKTVFFSYSIYYPDTLGHTFERRIELKPESCNGYKFRFKQEGWGLIQLQCNFKEFPIVECRIAANSNSRAVDWSQTYPEFKNPELWDWKVLEKKARRLIRLLRESSI